MTRFKKRKKKSRVTLLLSKSSTCSEWIRETSEKELRKQNPHKLLNKFQENTIAEANKRI